MPDRILKSHLAVLAGLSLAVFVYHMLTAALSSYGYFIDEFYYIACSKRLALGYVDHPALSILMLAVSRSLLGDSIPAVRFLSSLGIAATTFVTGLVTLRLGGSCTAAVIAALATMVMPVYLLMGSFYSMNAFDPLIWVSILYLVIRLVQDENMKLWLPIGLLMGLGLEMKHTMVLYGVALVAGMLLTPARRFLSNRWFLWGMLGCVLLLMPNIIWQVTHGFPSLEFYRNAMVNKNIPTGPLPLVLGQVIFANPFALPLWLIGLAYFLFSARGKSFRFLGWTYLLLLLVMILGQSSRPDRIAAMYTILFAGGAVALERLGRPLVQHLAPGLMILLLAFGGVMAVPLFTPLLPPPVLAGYISTLGISFDIEKGKTHERLPQWLADRLGWRELASDVSRVYHALPAEEQKNSIIVSTNYGEAGALELFAPEFGLPPVFATHNSFHMWGPPSDSVKTYIGVFVGRRDLEGRFESVVDAEVHTCEDCTRPQQRIPIYVARRPRFSVVADWQKFKIFD